MAHTRGADSAPPLAAEPWRGTAPWLALAPWLLVATLCGLLAAWRIYLIGQGPDPDTDAYGHYVIARQLLDTPTNLHIHWVWLPLYHLWLALGVAAGATLDDVRYVNALASAFTPLTLLWLLRRSVSERAAPWEHWLPALAAALAAAAPLAVESGTTAQPESCFTLLLVGAAALLTSGRLGWAAFLLSLLVLLRYEGWAVAACVAALLLVRRARGEALRSGAIACLVSPALAIGSWVVLRRLSGEPWLDFLHQNQSFAESALAVRPRQGSSDLARAIAGVSPAAWLLGAVGAAGLWRGARREGLWLWALPLSVLGFLTLGWLNRSHLGLSRHFVALLPFAAVYLAHGVALFAEGFGALGARLPAPPLPRWSRAQLTAFAFSLFGGALLLAELGHLDSRLESWREHTRTALPDRVLAGSFLRGVPESSLIVCDEASVEVLSDLPRSRFVRPYLGHGARSTVRALAATHDLYVLSWADRLLDVISLGRVVYRDSAARGLVGVHVAQRPPVQDYSSRQ
ncbi:MAG TPA: hypothetical protein VJU61_20820 [Polyangiaceae bacterium]|nr:hypothetical protein [Polyangiaceae bacterium]